MRQLRLNIAFCRYAKRYADVLSFSIHRGWDCGIYLVWQMTDELVSISTFAAILVNLIEPAWFLPYRVNSGSHCASPF